MDLRLLEAFRAVVDHRSVTNAAAAMGITQPAVSAQIARLEQESSRSSIVTMADSSQLLWGCSFMPKPARL